MRKPITIILALLIALSPVLAYAESMNFAALLASEDNKNLGNEDGVYNALYKILLKANGKDFPMNDWLLASTCLSKNAIGEELSPVETVFDESLSAYEKFFLLNLANVTLSDDEAKELTTVFERGLRAFPKDGQELYVSTEEDGYISGLMREATEKMGFKYEPETINETLTLYAIKDKDDKVIFSAPEVLTSLPRAILMKHVPEEKKQESAAALARMEAAIPYKIDWKKITSGDDVAFDDLDSLDDFFEDSEEDEEGEDDEDEEASAEEEEIVLTEEQIAEWTEKWMKLFFACDAYDIQPDEANYKLVTEALLDMVEDKPTVTFEPDGGISLKYDESLAPNATPAPSKKKSSGSSSSGSGTKAPAKALVDLVWPYTGYTGQYIIYVSKKSCTIAIIGRGSDGRYTKKVKTFPAAVGKAGQTRDGIFWLTKKERWHSWSGGTYSPYSVKQDGGSYIHGPIYTAKDSNRMLASSYNAIGTASSAGCLSTVCAAAGWIYYNCPTGTMVWIANDSKFKSSKPKKIPADQSYDPTEKNVKPTGADPGAAAAVPTPAPASSGSTGSTGSTATKTTATPTPAPAATATPEPAPEVLDIKQVQSLLIFQYGDQVDLSADIAAGIIGDNTKAAMNRFRTEYNSIPGVDQLKTDITTETKDTVAALVNALMTQQGVKDKLAMVQSKLPATNASGVYDENTVNAVSAFQTANGLPATGVADLVTQEKLNPTTQPTDTPSNPGEDDNKDVALTGFTVTPSELALEVEDTAELTVKKEPENSTTELTYKSSDEAVATVENGTVAAVGAGSATITVSAVLSDGNTSSQTVAVTVTESTFENIKKGSPASDVKKVQQLLVILGDLKDEINDKSAIDGDYGPKTAAAVAKFLGESEAVNEVDKSTMKRLLSDAKSYIKAAQKNLVTLGYLKEESFSEKAEKPMEYGVFDDKTDDAIVDFQKKFNEDKTQAADMLKVNGVPDEATRKALDEAVKAEESADSEVQPENAGDQVATDQPADAAAPADAETPDAPAAENKPDDQPTEKPADDAKDTDKPAEAPAETPESPAEAPAEAPDAAQKDPEVTEPAPADAEKPADDAQKSADDAEAAKQDAADEAAKKAAEETAKKAAEEEAAKKAAEEAAKKAAEEEAAKKAAEEAAKKAAEEEAAKKAAEEEAARKAAEEAAKKAAEEEAARAAAAQVAAEEPAASVAEPAEPTAE